MKLDFSKPIVTRDGKRVVITNTRGYHRYAGHRYPIEGDIEGGRQGMHWTRKGEYLVGRRERPEDLIQATPWNQKLNLPAEFQESNDRLNALISKWHAMEMKNRILLHVVNFIASKAPEAPANDLRAICLSALNTCALIDKPLTP